MTAVAEGMADGDLTRRLRLNRAEEIGTMANALDRANERTAYSLGDVRATAERLAETPAA